MAYADQTMSGNRVIALIIVALIHIGVGYVLVTGLAYSAVKEAIERVTTVDIEEPEPEEEEPEPPPPDEKPMTPPPVVPPPPFNLPQPLSQEQTIPDPPKDPPKEVQKEIFDPGPKPAPPPPPPPKFPPKPCTARGNAGSWVTPNDYPSRNLRDENEGVTGFSVTCTVEGRAENCQVTRSSGFPGLDEATCKNIMRRARFNAATDGDGNKTTGSYSNSVRWQIPKD